MRRGAVSAATALAAFSVAALAAGLGRGVLTTYLPVALDRIRDAPGLIGTVMLKAVTGDERRLGLRGVISARSGRDGASGSTDRRTGRTTERLPCDDRASSAWLGRA